MARVLSIDPGTRTLGAAIWVECELRAAACIFNPEKDGSGPGECAAMAHAVLAWGKAFWRLHGWNEFDTLALEIPQIYSRGGGKTIGDPNKIMPLFGVDAAIAALHPSARVHYVVPHEWKAGTSKPEIAKEKYVITERVMERLTAAEKATIIWPSSLKNTDTARKQDWDVSDSIGVGLHMLGRFARRRMFARE